MACFVDSRKMKTIFLKQHFLKSQPYNKIAPFSNVKSLSQISDQRWQQYHVFYSFFLSLFPSFYLSTISVSQQVGRDPLLGRRHSHLGRQNLYYNSNLVLHGSPNCVLFCLVGRQLPNVENHWFR